MLNAHTLAHANQTGTRMPVDTQRTLLGRQMQIRSICQSDQTFRVAHFLARRGQTRAHTLALARTHAHTHTRRQTTRALTL